MIECAAAPERCDGPPSLGVATVARWCACEVAALPVRLREKAREELRRGVDTMESRKCCRISDGEHQPWWHHLVQQGR
jgi:hypothetical protein